MLLGLLKWDFSGDTLARLEAFERECAVYLRMAGNHSFDDLKVGIVLSNMQDSPVRDNLIMSSERLNTWALFRTEMEQIMRVRAYTSTAMEVDAL